jgi:transposase
VKKRPRKISGQLLGKITQDDGFIESEKARLKKQLAMVENIQVKECGVATAIETLFAESLKALQTHFPNQWQRLACLAYGRLVHQAPLKNMAHHFADSFLSEKWPETNLSAKSLHGVLKDIGRGRDKIVDFCRSFKKERDNILFDGTDMFNQSRRLSLPEFSKGKSGVYGDMINQMWIFSTRRQEPVYYRLLPGNIKDVSAFQLCLLESGIEDATVVMDKGFASKANIAALEKAKLNFILPLHRNSTLLHYDRLLCGDKRGLDGYFKHEGRYIWYFALPTGEGQSVTVFLDEDLRAREQKDYLERVEKRLEGYSLEAFHERSPAFGTLALLSNTGKTASVLYAEYKARGSIETMIDTLKNILDADRAYMRDDQVLEGWMFVNLIALKWYYTLLGLLKKHELNQTYSVKDVLLFLSGIKKVKVHGVWRLAKNKKKSAALLQTLGIGPIT